MGITWKFASVSLDSFHDLFGLDKSCAWLSLLEGRMQVVIFGSMDYS